MRPSCAVQRNNAAALQTNGVIASGASVHKTAIDRSAGASLPVYLSMKDSGASGLARLTLESFWTSVLAARLPLLAAQPSI